MSSVNARPTTVHESELPVKKRLSGSGSTRLIVQPTYSSRGLVVRWSAGAETPQRLADGEIVLGSTYNGRLFALIEEQIEKNGADKIKRLSASACRSGSDDAGAVMKAATGA